MGRTDGPNTSFLQIDLIVGALPRLHFFLQNSEGGRQRAPLLQAYGLALSYEKEPPVIILRPHWTHWSGDRRGEVIGEHLAKLILTEDLLVGELTLDLQDTRACFFSGTYRLLRKEVDAVALLPTAEGGSSEDPTLPAARPHQGHIGRSKYIGEYPGDEPRWAHPPG